MHTTHLRQIGGSVMLAVPPAILDRLHLRAGATVGIAVMDGHVVIAPQPCLRYRLDDLLAQCDASADRSDEDQAWLAAKPCGRELL